MMNRLQLELGVLKKVFLWSVVSLAIGLGSCSGDDDETPGGGGLFSLLDVGKRQREYAFERHDYCPVFRCSGRF